MELVPATPDQILKVKRAAAARFKEKGIDPQVADALFNAQLAKVAEELGFSLDTPDTGDTAETKEAAAKVNTLADKMAAALSVTRKK